jgi:hypothetical protein
MLTIAALFYNMKSIKYLTSFCLLLITSILYSNDEKIIVRNFLEKEFKSVKIIELKAIENYQFVWEVIIQQDLDHNDPKKGSFPQKFILHHKGLKKANVLVTEGYQVGTRVNEPSLILDANQLAIEYRFYADSRPEKIDWKLLNHDQAMKDIYSIHKIIKKLYKNRWCATGISKGGTTCILYQLSYPKMLDATISYVGPFPNAQEDKRTITHYTSKIGTEECRKKIKDFQIQILNNRKDLILELDSLAYNENTSFPIGVNKVIDYAAAEYPFSFWQWGFSCDEIPQNGSSAEEIFNHVEEIVDFNYYDEKQCAQFLPAYYQFMTEYGYYGFDTTGISHLLSHKNLTNLTFCPKDAALHYDGTYMKEMTRKAERKIKNTILIYGENDTWTACALEPRKTANVLKYVKSGGGHRTRIRNLNSNEKNQIYSSLQKWMKVKTVAL